MASRVLVAFSEWLKLANSNTLDGAALAQQPLVTAALEGLKNEETFDAAVDAAVELVYITSHGGQPDEKMLPLVARLVPAVRPLFGCSASSSACLDSALRLCNPAECSITCIVASKRESAS